MAYRYYSTLRPLMVGGIPLPETTRREHYHNRQLRGGPDVLQGHRPARVGYIEYTAPLDQQQVSDYELVQAPQEADHE